MKKILTLVVSVLFSFTLKAQIDDFYNSLEGYLQSSDNRRVLTEV